MSYETLFECRVCGRKYDPDSSTAMGSGTYCSKGCEASAENAEQMKRQQEENDRRYEERQRADEERQRENDRRYKEQQEENDRRQREDDRRYEERRRENDRRYKEQQEENNRRQRESDRRYEEQQRENNKLREELSKERKVRQHNEQILKCTQCGKNFKRLSGFLFEELTKYYVQIKYVEGIQEEERRGKMWNGDELGILEVFHNDVYTRIHDKCEIIFCSEDCKDTFVSDNVLLIEDIKKKNRDAVTWERTVGKVRQEEYRKRLEEEVRIREQKREEQLAREEERREQERQKEENDRKQLLSELENDIRGARRFDDLPGYGRNGGFSGKYRWLKMTGEEDERLQRLMSKKQKALAIKEYVLDFVRGLGVVGAMAAVSVIICNVMKWGVVGGFWMYFVISIIAINKVDEDRKFTRGAIGVALSISIVWILTSKFL